MRTCDKFERSFAWDRIDRNPKAYIVPAFDIIIGLILVPRRALHRSGLLGQHMIVMEANNPAGHQFRSDGRNLRIENDLAIMRVTLPVTEILNELAGIIRSTGGFRRSAGMRQIVVDTLS
jgi:hypothetical protein